MGDRYKLEKMENPFDYEKYIPQIKIRPWYETPGEFTYTITIDCVDLSLTVRKTVTGTEMVNDQIYDLEDEAHMAELLPLMELKHFQEFESLSEQELQKRIQGQRDGWYVKYTYYVHENLQKVSGKLDTIYADSPLEKIIEWIKRNFGDKDIKI